MHNYVHEKIAISLFDYVGKEVKKLYEGYLDVGDFAFPVGSESQSYYLVVRSLRHPLVFNCFFP